MTGWMWFMIGFWIGGAMGYVIAALMVAARDGRDQDYVSSL